MTRHERLSSALQPRDQVGAPHRPLPGYQVDGESREQFVRRLFNRTAASYDRLNAAFSLGTGQRYRRRALLSAGLKPGDRVLDVAVGTGLVAREACFITGQPRNVIGLDVSEGMLAQARRQLSIGLVQARAEAIPLGDATVDFVSIGYALRHVSDLERVFSEFLRVLKPGGRLLIMEITAPGNRMGENMLKIYLGHVVPWLSRMLHARHERTLMQYYWDTIEACVPPDAILGALKAVGFISVSCQTELSIFRAYLGQRKPDEISK
ncbi:MAG TPA: class I SAM-dependent methyltransferase [Crenalkalicoccus sp.]|nr:class I SAM-dependent methyltransferase [Crenalkalicoccus sp.]